MDINSRIRSLRKKMNLNQNEFAQRISITQPSLSDIENGKTENIDSRNIKIICSEFGVREEWLKEGKGNIFVNPDFEQLISFNLVLLDDMDKKIISEYVKLRPEHRKVIKNFIRNLLDSK